jgi:integrase/recombinase XerD
MPPAQKPGPPRLEPRDAPFTFQYPANFIRLASRCGISPRSGSCRSRLHDFRHAFAVTSLLESHRKGEDVAAMLPRLATFLGHADPKHTFWYLSAAPELMAGKRLDARLGGRA